jgi:HAD superfamily hydrolase (TIGR01509 family)
MALSLVFDIDDTIYVHQRGVEITPYNTIRPDYQLKTLLQRIPYPKYVLTNATYGHANLIVNKMGIVDEFERVYSRDNIPAMKPDPHCYYAVYQNIATTMITKPQIIFFDDMLPNLEAAKGQGWYTVWISPDFKGSNYPYVNKAFPTLKEALEKMRF